VNDDEIELLAQLADTAYVLGLLGAFNAQEAVPYNEPVNPRAAVIVPPITIEAVTYDAVNEPDAHDADRALSELVVHVDCEEYRDWFATSELVAQIDCDAKTEVPEPPTTF